MRALLGLALAAGMVAASPASATSYLCKAEVKGPVSGMLLTQVVGSDGKPKPANLRWFAPHPPGQPNPSLMIDYAIPDTSKVGLGKVTQATATLAMVMTALPKAKSADLILTFADKSESRVPWQLYGVARGPMPPEGQPLHLDVSGSTILVSGAKEDAAEDAVMLKGLTAGGMVRVRVQGDDGTIFADNTIDLGATPGRDVQLQDVFGQMRHDLVDPDLSCKPQ
ncbi:hypothetical protein ACO2Q3_16885 [Caulobacter sp. KR2-114]|uniref:hypothetical protein n=1 Tax=Caulobacter sp. KR2-114 TaxID=3400912 RepID=UPI003BFDE397